jgi:hypothetical protein
MQQRCVSSLQIEGTSGNTKEKQVSEVAKAPNVKKGLEDKDEQPEEDDSILENKESAVEAKGILDLAEQLLVTDAKQSGASLKSIVAAVGHEGGAAAAVSDTFVHKSSGVSSRAFDKASFGEKTSNDALSHNVTHRLQSDLETSEN